MTWLDRCHFGDVRDVLRRMIADGVQVQTIVTSPPYWGLRDYGHPGQLGQEPTIQEFVSTMVEVFDLARQVLADDGSAWVNMGDSYAGSGRGGNSDAITGAGKDASKCARPMTASRRRDNALIPRSDVAVPGLKPKDLVGQPWRLAFALQDAGWYLRQDIIWSKPNPMPESIKDRCTKAHEYIFLLSKSDRYYFDFDTFQEPVSGGANPRRPGNGYKTPDGWDTSKGDGGHGSVHKEGREKGRKLATASSGTKNNDSFDAAMAVMPTMRNRRSVWTVPTESFSGAHFATYPRALIEPCILAGCPVGGTVLDPFFGSGTTGQVAQKLGRRFIGIELNPEYEPLQAMRLAQRGLELEAA